MDSVGEQPRWGLGVEPPGGGMPGSKTTRSTDPTMGSTTRKHSYTIPCSSAFRDAVGVLAEARQVNVADLARSVLLVVPAKTVAAFADPGEPGRGDRETVVLKSGPAEGRPWRRKPRLQIRMAPGYEVPIIRRALALALAISRGGATVNVAAAGAARAKDEAARKRTEEIAEEVERLRAIVSVLVFEPLHGGVTSREDALHVLGFPPRAHPGKGVLRARYRMLATIHHPDGAHGNHERMSQINAAMAVLRGD
jgi:hypothetical protein